MIRAVYDTNIVISGSLWSGTPRHVIQLATEGYITVLISEAMLDELRDVLARPKFSARLNTIGRSAENIIAGFLRHVEVIDARPIVPVIQADPDDDHVIACAVAGAAEYVVTGDPHLLELGHYEKIQIVDALAFLEIVSHTGMTR